MAIPQSQSYRILVLFSTRFIEVMTVLIVSVFDELHFIKLIAEVIVRNKLFVMLAQTVYCLVCNREFLSRGKSCPFFVRIICFFVNRRHAEGAPMYLLVNKALLHCVICFAGRRDTARHLTSKVEAFMTGISIWQKMVKKI